jgi:hypothetical protein
MGVRARVFAGVRTRRDLRKRTQADPSEQPKIIHGSEGWGFESFERASFSQVSTI